jgi:hypothetical protein
MSKTQTDGAKARLLLAKMKRLLPRMKKAAEADRDDGGGDMTMSIYEVAKELKSEIGDLHSDYYYSVAKELLIDINNASVSRDELAVQAAQEDPINPQHYAGLSIEPIDAIESWGLGFHLGNAVKYIARAGRKTPNMVIDLEKSIWYIQRMIKVIKGD